jgi:hypothetical protein
MQSDSRFQRTYPFTVKNTYACVFLIRGLGLQIAVTGLTWME